MRHSLRRRSVLVAGAGVMLPMAGCLGNDGGSNTPQEHAYTLTITGSGDQLDARVEPAGEVADVVQVHVGDTLEFTIRNDTDGPVGVHNHATDTEVVVESGGDEVMTFEATEAMTGRHELEGWPAEGGSADGNDHGEAATSLVVIEVRPAGS